MSVAVDLLREIQSRGCTVEIAGNRLRVRPKAKVLDLAPEILRRADDLAAAIRGPAPPGRSGWPDGPIPIEEIEPDPAAPVVYRFKIVIDALGPVAVPVELQPGVRAVDVPKAIAAMLLDLRAAAALYGEVCADAGDDRLLRLATEAGLEIERLIEDLARLGCRVRVVGVQ